MKLLPRSTAMIALTLIGEVALAHPGHTAADSGDMLAAGLLHPLTGTDHLLAMLAVGLWAATSRANHNAITILVSFLALLLVGAVAGMAVAGVAAIEPMIIASLLVLGLLLASRVSVPLWAGPALAGAFALFHGMAHGAEMLAGGSVAAYIVGFMFSTLALLLTGLAAGWMVSGRALWLSRLAGAGIAAYGLALWSGAA
ncbi:HupE/UreJ family protein [Pollutimonas thiosulfatoxidans]|uniref:Urease accessory protein UreJ n=1 Tax=Pollutimonas thiosulfatoxidans TaxID=2028345 RepID=A0A410G9N6_9BURK|nr:HupE/UreJ family protein [Pollutimonas thiosulfatoxidans]QAA93022.1 hypothetical protein CKA81_03560 [Pollutimonas thiosulfatoxidans]